MRLIQFALVAGILATGIAHAQEDRRPLLGATAGLFMPSGSAIKDVFGESIFSYGLGAVASKPRRRQRMFSSFGVLSANKGGSKFFLLPAVTGYEFQFADNETTSAIPYLSAGVGVAYADYAISRGGRRFSSKRFLATGTVEAGVTFNRNLRLSARYHAFTKADDFYFNGLEFRLAYGFFR